MPPQIVSSTSELAAASPLPVTQETTPVVLVSAELLNPPLPRGGLLPPRRGLPSLTLTSNDLQQPSAIKSPIGQSQLSSGRQTASVQVGHPHTPTHPALGLNPILTSSTPPHTHIHGIYS